MSAPEHKKLKRKHLTLKDKLKVIEARKKGYSLARLATDFSIGKSTVHDILKHEQKLTTYVAERNREEDAPRKTMRTADDKELDEAVYLWFTQERMKGTPIIDPLISQKARMLHKIMYPEAPEDVFIASQGWLYRFKQRHEIRELRLQGESLSADTGAVEHYKLKFQETIEKEQLPSTRFLMPTRLGCYWRLLPQKTLASSNEKSVKNLKTSKDRVTILAAANASGDFRLPLLLIGKSKNPRCLKNLHRTSRPVVYADQQKAWMNGSIFTRWFFDHFVPLVKSYLKKKGSCEIAISSSLERQELRMPNILSPVSKRSSLNRNQCKTVL